MMKLILRLLHFLIYFLNYVSKLMAQKSTEFRLNIRLKIIRVFYGFSDETIVDRVMNGYDGRFLKREALSKKSTHTAIVLNRFENNPLE